MSDNPSMISKKNGDESSRYKKDIRNHSGNNRSSESLGNKRESLSK